MKQIMLFWSLLFFVLTAFAQKNMPGRIYELWDDRPADNRGGDWSIITSRGYPFDADWEQQSYPIGNGYMGANVFGRTDIERIQITEKTLSNEGPYANGGITNFAEIYLDFNQYDFSNYKRSLNLNDGILYVNYMHEGVHYQREYLANYPDNVIAIKLSADKAAKISFRLRAEIPHLRSLTEKNTRFGKIQAESDLMTLSGTIPNFSLNYEAQIKVINEGGKIITTNHNQNSEIRVVEANSVVILIAAGTNYSLSKDVFLETTHNKKLDASVFPHNQVALRIHNATQSGYEKIKASHVKDYQQLFSRITLNLSPAVSTLTTAKLLEQYKNEGAISYLEELMFQYGRYLLIASSRKGTLPSGLQGVWSQYAVTPWSGGYWHNINVQMNYWGAFSANLKETFTPYIEYHLAYRPQAEKLATDYIKKYNPNVLNKKDDNGWTIGTGATAYHIGAPGSHSGPGTGGFTTKLLWDRYAFSNDTAFLREVGYPALLGMSKFLSKTLKPADNGLWLVDPSASPEIRIISKGGKDYGEYYITKGATFDQGFVWETFNDLLKAARVLGMQDSFLTVVKEQMKKLDPILIGKSGQIKEYREENEYGEIGDPYHRHISHLCTLYPGTLINSNTPEWLKAAGITLDKRTNFTNANRNKATTGWALVHRLNLRARTKEAEKAHESLSLLINQCTYPNLWCTHPPFQIDANLGLVAGMAEMLVQSHEGFIELLPALPAMWQTGSFYGLIARGNFEVSASWNNKKLTACTVISKSGGVCRLKLPDIKGLHIITKNGNKVSYSKEVKNRIRFNTNKMDEYFISFN
jgi:alpha-L-fucosidase 2